MKKKIIYGLLFAVAMVTASSSFVSCKDYEGDDYAGLRERMIISEVNAQTTIDELIRLQQAQIQYQIDNLKDALGKMQEGSAEKNATQKLTDDAQAKLDALMAKYEAATSLQDKLAILNEMNEILREVTGTSDNPSTIYVPSAVETIINLWGDSLTAAYDKAFEAYNLANTANTTANNADALSKDNKYRLDTLTLRADSLYNEAILLTAAATTAVYNDLLNNYINKLDSAYKAGDSILNGKIDQLALDHAKDIKDLDSAYKAGDKEIKELIEALDSAYKAGDSLLTVRCNEIEAGYKKADSLLQVQINDLKEDVANLKQDLQNLTGVLKKQITGIIVQGTYSPVFGYGSLPLGIQTNILSAYVGNVQIAGGKFPSFNSGNYASEKCIFTEGDIQYLSGVATEAVPEGILMNEEDGNAGYMYLTVNPTNIDFTGTDFFLVNSKGDESRIKLSKLEASDDELTFGWTRGTSVGKESPNGFYKVVATIDKGDAKKIQPQFDKAGFKQAVKLATEGQKRMAVKEVAKALFNSLQPTPRFGVKAEWVDTVTTKDKTAKRSVTSAYDIAALSIEPLGFGFKSLDGVIKLPTIDAKVIAEDMHVTLTMGDIKVTPKDGSYKVTTDIHLVEFNPNIINFNKETGKYEFVGDATTYEIVTVGGKNISILNKDQLVNLFRQGDVIEIDVTNFVKEIYGEFNKELEKIDFSGTTANLNKQIDKIANTVNSYVDRANGWINRFNNLFAHLSNALQPVLLWSDGESSGELGGIVSANYVVGKPVKAGSNLILIPTTYSLELFAPAYKKSLLVTNAYDLKTGDSAQKGNADLKSAADALSAQLTKYASYKSTPSLNKDNMIKINVGSKTGVTYEIAYTALDYEGKVAGRKFYITVVE